MTQILVPGQSRQIHRGFTLIEVMVVLLVLGISLALITPQFMKSDEDVLKEESARLVALMEYAADFASSRGHWLAWSPTASGYRFLQRDEEKEIWQPVTTDSVLRERVLPEGMQLGAADAQQMVGTSGQRVMLSPTGINAPFQIVLRVGNVKRVIKGNLLGKVDVLNSDGS